MKKSNRHSTRTTSKNTWSRRLRHTMGSLGLLLLLGTSATAQNPTGPFSGQYQEGFEGTMSLAFGYSPNSVLQGNASYHTSSAYQATSWGFNCTIQPHGGNRFVGDAGSLMWLDFGTEVSKFGGYFGSNQPGPPVTVDVRFFDIASNLLATDVMTLQNNCSWEWKGWSFPMPNVTRIEFETSPYPGFLMMDDLELDFPIYSGCATLFCFGDGSVANCPCSNNSNSGGCANGSGNGASLYFTGSCSVSMNDAGLAADNVTSNGWALFFEGSSTLPGGGTPFVDGILCVGGPYVGVEFVMAGSSGGAGTSTSLVSPPGVGSIQHSPGDLSYYQCFYHTPGGNSACGSSWNLTNGVQLAWMP